MEQRTDEEQVQRLREWVNEYWKPVVGGVVVGLAGVLGWQGWGSHQEQQSRAASGQFDAVTTAVESGDLDAAAAGADALISDYKGTLYASLASLTLAKAYADAERFDDAAETLTWVANYGQDAPTRALASLRLARIQWAQGDTDAAITTLTNSQPPEAFRAPYLELQGDLQNATGDAEAARKAYADALGAMDVNSPARASVDRKLAELGAPAQDEQAS